MAKNKQTGYCYHCNKKLKIGDKLIKVEPSTWTKSSSSKEEFAYPAFSDTFSFHVECFEYLAGKEFVAEIEKERFK